MKINFVKLLIKAMIFIIIHYQFKPQAWVPKKFVLRESVLFRWKSESLQAKLWGLYTQSIKN